jgi:hypothetical protein
MIRTKMKRECIISEKKKNIQPKNKLNNEYEKETKRIKFEKETESFRFMQILHTKLFVLGAVCMTTSLFFVLFVQSKHTHINFTAKLKHAYTDKKKIEQN